MISRQELTARSSQSAAVVDAALVRLLKCLGKAKNWRSNHASFSGFHVGESHQQLIKIDLLFFFSEKCSHFKKQQWGLKHQNRPE